MLSYSDDIIEARLDAVADGIDRDSSAGAVRIYSGTRPAKGGSPTTLLAELALSFPFAASNTSGVLTADEIAPDEDAPATGTATWFRVVDGDDGFCMDGDVGDMMSNAELKLPTTTINEHQTVSISSFTITAGNNSSPTPP